ncbi:MAG: hypothetical protein FWG77_09595, partial [Treponema sp.]|nr:hypothetical protein [Treponema sp.]
ASDTGYTSIADNKAWVDNPFTATLAARLAMANLLTAVANLRLSYDTELEANAISSTITFYTPALPFIDIYGEFILSRLDSFSERGNFQGRLDLIVPYGSVQDDVTIGINAEYMTSMLEANVDPVITATAWFNYRGITNVLPRLEVGYARGATFSGTATAFGNWGVLFRRSSTYNADNSFLHIKPSVQLRVAANQQVELGGYIAADMSSGNANTSVGGAAEKGTTFGAYVGYQLNF